MVAGKWSGGWDERSEVVDGTHGRGKRLQVVYWKNGLSAYTPVPPSVPLTSPEADGWG